MLHIYVVHVATLGVALLAGYPAPYHTNFLADPFRLVNAGWGYDLAIVYVVGPPRCNLTALHHFRSSGTT